MKEGLVRGDTILSRKTRFGTWLPSEGVNEEK